MRKKIVLALILFTFKLYYLHLRSFDVLRIMFFFLNQRDERDNNIKLRLIK